MINGSEGGCKKHKKGNLTEDLQNSNILAEPKLCHYIMLKREITKCTERRVASALAGG